VHEYTTKYHNASQYEEILVISWTSVSSSQLRYFHSPGPIRYLEHHLSRG